MLIYYIIKAKQKLFKYAKRAMNSAGPYKLINQKSFKLNISKKIMEDERSSIYTAMKNDIDKRFPDQKNNGNFNKRKTGKDLKSKSPCVLLRTKVRSLCGLLDARSVPCTKVRGLSNTSTLKLAALSIGVGIFGDISGCNSYLASYIYSRQEVVYENIRNDLPLRNYTDIYGAINGVAATVAIYAIGRVFLALKRR